MTMTKKKRGREKDRNTDTTQQAETQTCYSGAAVWGQADDREKASPLWPKRLSPDLGKNEERGATVARIDGERITLSARKSASTI